MADDDIKYSFSGKEPRIDEESHQEFTRIKMNQGAAWESTESNETK